jgi:glutamine synthetase
MKQLLGEGMAILAPNANSYRRFKANSYAPVAATWGVNNRTVSCAFRPVLRRPAMSSTASRAPTAIRTW